MFPSFISFLRILIFLLNLILYYIILYYIIKIPTKKYKKYLNKIIDDDLISSEEDIIKLRNLLNNNLQIYNQNMFIKLVELNNILQQNPKLILLINTIINNYNNGSLNTDDLLYFS